jgi:membrane-associated phospholipid phosphatase
VRLAVLVCLLIVSGGQSGLSAGQEPIPWALDSHRQAVSRLTDAAVWAQIGAETITNWRADNRRHALGCQALRAGVGFGATELLKRVVHRDRPDHSDRKSMPSMHAMAGALHSGWSWQIAVPIDGLIWWGRPASLKHYGSDVAAGASIGFLSRQVCHD